MTTAAAWSPPRPAAGTACPAASPDVPGDIRELLARFAARLAATVAADAERPARFAPPRPEVLLLRRVLGLRDEELAGLRALGAAEIGSLLRRARRALTDVEPEAAPRSLPPRSSDRSRARPSGAGPRHPDARPHRCRGPPLRGPVP